MSKSIKGFTLIELLITLVVSSVLISLLINSFSSLLKSKVSSQQRLEVNIQANNLSLWFNQLFSRLKQYNFYDVHNKALESKAIEQDLIQQHPILYESNGLVNINLFSEDGNQSDKLVIFYQGSKGCNGQRFGYTNNELWLVIDEIYLQQDNLRCKSHDARYLLGLSNRSYTSRSVSLMQDVSDLQVKYLSTYNGLHSWLDAKNVRTHHTIIAAKLSLVIRDELSFNNPITLTLPIGEL